MYIAGPNGGCVPLRFVDSDRNAIKVVYIPTREGEHKIFIKFGGVPIKGSPFKVQIRGRAPFLTLEEKVSAGNPSVWNPYYGSITDGSKLLNLLSHRLSLTFMMTTDFHLIYITR